MNKTSGRVNDEKPKIPSERESNSETDAARYERTLVGRGERRTSTSSRSFIIISGYTLSGPLSSPPPSLPPSVPKIF
jgi:hypothetical protein